VPAHLSPLARPLETLPPTCNPCWRRCGRAVWLRRNEGLKLPTEGRGYQNCGVPLLAGKTINVFCFTSAVPPWIICASAPSVRGGPWFSRQLGYGDREPRI